MKARKKISLILASSLFLLFTTAGFVFAREVEVRLPGQDWAAGSLPILSDYVKSVFKFVLMFSGLIVGGVIFFAGVKLVMSAQNPAAMSDAKSKILDGVIGVVIIFASWLLLNALNPQLVLINPELNSNTWGVTLYHALPNNPNFNMRTDQKTITASQPFFENFTPVFYKFNTPPSYLKAYTYSDQNYGSGRAELKECKDKTGICGFASPPQSIELDYQYPGVYLCRDAGGKDSCVVYNSSAPKIDEALENKVTKIFFKNPYVFDEALEGTNCTSKPGGTIFTTDAAGNMLPKPTCFYYTDKYGAILHEGRNYKNTCKEFLADSAIIPGQTNVFPGPAPNEGVSSITVFRQAFGNPAEGVTLYKEAQYQEKDSNDKDIFKFYPYISDLLKYANINGAIYGDDSKVGDHALSLRIKGNYMALLFENPKFEHNCEVLMGDDPNLGVDNPVGEGVSSLKIVPIKK